MNLRANQRLSREKIVCNSVSKGGNMLSFMQVRAYFQQIMNHSIPRVCMHIVCCVCMRLTMHKEKIYRAYHCASPTKCIFIVLTEHFHSIATIFLFLKFFLGRKKRSVSTPFFGPRQEWIYQRPSECNILLLMTCTLQTECGRHLACIYNKTHSFGNQT